MKKPAFHLMSMVIQAALWVFIRIDYYFTKSRVSVSDHKQFADPYSVYNTLRERGAILRSYSNNGWMILGYKEVEELFKDRRLSNDVKHNAFFTRLLDSASGDLPFPLIENPTIVQADPPDHTRLRKLVVKGFAHKYVQSLAPKIEHLVDELLQEIPDGATQVDITSALTKPLPAIVIAEMMGVPVHERHYFEQWSEAFVGFAVLDKPEGIRVAAQGWQDMRQYLETLVETKRSNPGEDLISHLIAAEEEHDKLSLEEIYSTCIVLLVAGHETTTRLIGNCLYLLLQHPKQMDMARQDEALLMNAVEETLRYEPPLQYTVRFITESFEFGQHQFKHNQTALVSIAAANRDPEINNNPDTFDITRNNIKHFSFGHGIHLCLGMSLARLETKIALQKLFTRFPEMRLAQDTPDWEPNPMFRGLQTLIVRTSRH
ncbi:MAG: cytochrome P450 [Pseudomonadota bacterium]